MAEQNYANLWGFFTDDLDAITHFLGATFGNGVISGLAVSQRGAGPNMSVDVAAGEARVNGTRRSFGSVTNVTLTAADGTNPRKDIIVINSAGSLIKRDGTAAAASPGGDVRRKTLSPIPPELVAGDLVLAEVWVAAGVTSILDIDISSRTINCIEGSDTNPTTIQSDDAQASGTADDLARRDHRHGIVNAAPVPAKIGAANAEGSSTSFARADHVHEVNFWDNAWFFDDFYGNALQNPWTITEEGTSTVFLLSADNGQVETNCTANNDRATLHFGTNLAYRRGLLSVMEIRLAAIGSGFFTKAFVFGFAELDEDGTSMTVGNERAVFHTNVTAAHWFAETSDGSTASTEDTTITKDDNFHTYRIEMRSGDIRFFIDGTLRVTKTTNLPANGTLMMPWLGTHGVGRDLQIDYVAIYQNRT